MGQFNKVLANTRLTNDWHSLEQNYLEQKPGKLGVSFPFLEFFSHCLLHWQKNPIIKQVGVAFLKIR